MLVPGTRSCCCVAGSVVPILNCPRSQRQRRRIPWGANEATGLSMLGKKLRKVCSKDARKLDLEMEGFEKHVGKRLLGRRALG